MVEGQNVINEQNGNIYPNYVMFNYQGVYVYSIDINNGFTLKGRITHLSDADYQMAGNNGNYYDQEINRILYINDTFFTISNKMIKATGMEDMEDIGQVEIN